MFRKPSPKPVIPHQITIDEYRCHACGACVAVCLGDALFLRKNHLWADPSACTGCERCLKACPTHALSLAALSPVH
jgi:NAD-dependent dihydropyrimidine dehydrogenase PreA subunit